MTESKIRAASAALWSTVEIAARYGAQFVVMVVLARMLSPEDFGLAAILLIFTSLGMLLVDGGFGTALIQRQRVSRDDETTVFLFNIGAAILGAAALFVLAPAIARFFEQERLLDLTRVMAIVLPLGALAAVPDALLAMNLDFKARARAEAVASVVSGAVAILLAWRGFGVWSLAWHSITGVFVRALLLWIFSGWRPRGRYSSESFRNLFGFGGYMLASGLLNTIAVRMQSLLIGKLFDPRELGYYTLAQNTQQAPASLVGSLLNRIGLPIFSTIAQDPVKLQSAMRDAMRMSMFLFFPCMIGIALTAVPLIDLVYGARWAPAAPILSVLALAAAMWPMHVLNISVIGAQGKSNLLLRLELVKQVVAILLILVSARWGIMAIAWSVFASSLFALAVNTYYCRKLLGYGALAQIVDQAPTFLLAAAAAIPGWAVLHWTAPGPGTMFLAILLAATTYLSLAALTRNSALSGVLSMIRALRAS